MDEQRRRDFEEAARHFEAGLSAIAAYGDDEMDGLLDAVGWVNEQAGIAD